MEWHFDELKQGPASQQKNITQGRKPYQQWTLNLDDKTWQKNIFIILSAILDENSFTSLYTSSGSGNLRKDSHALVNFNFIFFLMYAVEEESYRTPTLNTQKFWAWAENYHFTFWSIKYLRRVFFSLRRQAFRRAKPKSKSKNTNYILVHAKTGACMHKNAYKHTFQAIE